MDSISSIAFGIAGNRSDASGSLTFLGKLMERLWFGRPAVALPTRAVRSSDRPSPGTGLPR